MRVIEIPLSRGYIAIVNKDDAIKYNLLDHKWTAECANPDRKINKHVYAFRRITVAPYVYKKVRLHRLIMDCPDGLFVDHINGNTLDNRRENLRICTAQENGRNQRPQERKKSSKFKGVSFCNARSVKRPWRACIKNNETFIGIGQFQTEEDAALAYNQKARELFGEFACLNLL